MKNISFLIVLIPLILFMSTGIGENLTSSDKTLEDMIKNGEDIAIIDVRTETEYRDGHIVGAINMPYDEIQNLIGDIPKDKQIVLYCRSGRRSGIAYDKLRELGYKYILDYKRFSDWNGEVE